MSDRIELTVEPTNLKIAKGIAVESKITLHNLGQTVDQFSISVAGLDPKWYKLPVSSVGLFPNDRDNVKVIINVPENLCNGVSFYPFQVIATSEENPQDTTISNLSLEIGEDAGVELSASPVPAPGRRGSYNIEVSNPGIKEYLVHLKAGHPQNRLNFQFRMDSLTVPAGGKIGTVLHVKPKWLDLLLGEKTYDFQITAGRQDAPKADNICLDVRYPGVPWYQFILRLRIPWISRPPNIKTFSVKTDNKREFNITWEVKRSAHLKLDGAAVEKRGETLVIPNEPHTYVLAATNRWGTTTRTVDVKPFQVPEPRTSENIKVSILPQELQTKAGFMPAMATIQVQNLSNIVDKFLVSVEGLDEKWYNQPASSIALMPQASDQIQITFLPPNVRGVTSGIYKFAITVRSQSIAQESSTIIGQLEILPTVDYRIKVHPFHISGIRRAATNINITNIAVTGATINLEASDLDDGCKYKFDPPNLTLRAWNSIEVPLRIKPKRGSFFGAIKRFSITITASTEGVMPITANCEFSHNPLIKSWKPIFRAFRTLVVVLILLGAALLVIRWGGGWDALRTNPLEWLRTIIRSVQNLFVVT
jgi:uncharacterized membrane protein